MEKRLVNQNQIEMLHSFVRSHYVEYLDVQIELVDHLAQGIEAQWNGYPERSFEQCLEIEFKKFGVFGFMEVVEKKSTAMNKKYRRLLWRYTNEWFSIPNIILVMGAIFLLYIVLGSEILNAIKFEILVGLFMVLASVALIRTFHLKKQLNNKPKKWLLEELIFNLGAYLQVILLPIHLLNFNNSLGLLDTNWGLLLWSALVVVSVLLYILSAYIIPAKAEELLAEVYPEYKLVD